MSSLQNSTALVGKNDESNYIHFQVSNITDHSMHAFFFFASIAVMILRQSLNYMFC